MTDLYNRTALEDHTRANADDVNNETAKIKAAIDSIVAMVSALQEGGGGSGDGIARYAWLAFADSSDGTTNFSHSPGNRAYLGIASNKLTATPSDFPEDYTWALIRGSDAPTLRLVSSAQRFEFDDDGVSTGASEILFTAEGTNLATAIQFSAKNDSGSAVTLTVVNAAQVKLEVADFAEADWVQVITLANGGAVSDSIVITARRDSRPISWQGRWRNDVSYAKNDLTGYSGHAFISLIDNNLNHAPDSKGQDNSFWDAFAVGGAVGDPSTPDSAPTSTINLVTTTGRVNLRSLANAAGYRGKANANYTFVVPNGVTITGLSTEGHVRKKHESGSIAIDTGEWPVNEYAIVLVVTVQSGGVVRGGGGNGGDGGRSGRSGGRGLDGGDAIYCRANMTVNINAGGKVEAGGGGGPGGVSDTTGWPISSHRDAGGGGGGFPNGAGGQGGGSGADGMPGTVAGGGLGGAPGGANGGNAAVSVANGGTAGYAVRKNGNTVTVNNSGTMTGTAA
jgi:hypothetical protein